MQGIQNVRGTLLHCVAYKANQINTRLINLNQSLVLAREAVRQLMFQILVAVHNVLLHFCKVLSDPMTELLHCYSSC